MTGPTGPFDTSAKALNRSSDTPRSELRYLAIGQVARAHGVHGEVSVTVLTDFPERFETAEWVYLGSEMDADPYQIDGYRWHKQNVLLQFAGVTDRFQANKLRGLLVQIPIEEAMPLADGEYYLYQLLGLSVVTVNGKPLGTITNIIETKANDVYVVTTSDNQEILLPSIPDVVKHVDLEGSRVTVELIDGLI